MSGRNLSAPPVNPSKLRRQIAFAAARLMHSCEVDEYFQAKIKAARSAGLRRPRPVDLPSNAEIREQLRSMSRMLDPDGDHLLYPMRRRALFWMRKLSRFHPRMLGSVLTGDIRPSSDIDLHLFTNHPASVVQEVDRLGFPCELIRKRFRKSGECVTFTHVHIRDTYPIELTVYRLGDMGRRFRSSITGKPIETASADQLERLIALDHSDQLQSEQPSVPCDDPFDGDSLNGDTDGVRRWTVYASLLIPLSDAMGHPVHHPEGDTLYHSL